MSGSAALRLGLPMSPLDPHDPGSQLDTCVALLVRAECNACCAALQVLDMCAAPGGKTLAILMHLSAKGSLVCNDVSVDRRRRLAQVIASYLPRERRNQVRVPVLGNHLINAIRVYPAQRMYACPARTYIRMPACMFPSVGDCDGGRRRGMGQISHAHVRQGTLT
jgi:hypothetical protein